MELAQPRPIHRRISARGILQAQSLALQVHREQAIVDKKHGLVRSGSHRVGRALRKDKRGPRMLARTRSRGPAVRVADPEEADPAQTKRGHAQGSAIGGFFGQNFLTLCFLAFFPVSSCCVSSPPYLTH